MLSMRPLGGVDAPQAPRHECRGAPRSTSPDPVRPQPGLCPPLELTLLSRFHLAIIRPHLTLPSVLYEARGPSEPRASRCHRCCCRPTSRSPPMNWSESVAIRVGVLLA